MDGLCILYPTWRRFLQPSTVRSCLQSSRAATCLAFQPLASSSSSPIVPFAGRAFSTTPQLWKKKRRRDGPRDMRVRMIRYHLQHPLTPRPLRFSRNRFLRHWTIHRAWQLYRAKLRVSQEKELERQFNSMRDACEALRLIGEDGLAVSQVGNAVPPPGARDVKHVVFEEGNTKFELDVGVAAEQQKEVGKLFRISMMKTGVWDGVPIEYARAQTDTPPRAGWDHNWMR